MYINWILRIFLWYNRSMSETDTKDELDEHLTPAGVQSDEPEYKAWKEAKVKKGLAESEDRSKLVPAHKVWKDLGLER